LSSTPSLHDALPISLGPLLFSLILQPLLQEFRGTFICGYLDDVGMGDTASHLVAHVRSLEKSAKSIGLSLNHSKCEVIGLAPDRSEEHTSELQSRVD